MADKERDDDRGEETPSLTPEQRIAKLEKGRTLSLVLIVVLAVLSIVELAGLGYLMMAPDDQRPGQNVTRITSIEESVRELQTAQSQAQQLVLQSQLLQAKLDQVLTEADINNFANLRKILSDQERSYSNFIRTLQQGMYEISHMVRGSRTWYEVYKEDLDKILQTSSGRLTRLEAIKPAGS